MTSSLVGSEMCIRDSCTRAMPRRAGTTCASARAREMSLPPLTSRHHKNCLLYTSDAADDM
eukprot:7767563-Prorocentrum_lima.AAC.1